MTYLLILAVVVVVFLFAREARARAELARKARLDAALLDLARDAYQEGVNAAIQHTADMAPRYRPKLPGGRGARAARAWLAPLPFSDYTSEEHLEAALGSCHGRPVEVCFTGWSDAQRGMMEQLADGAGMKVRTNVSRCLVLLVAGPNAGPVKVSHAHIQGAAIISGERFADLIQKGWD